MEIGLLSEKDIEAYERLFREVVTSTDYYSDYAKRGEVEKYSDMASKLKDNKNVFVAAKKDNSVVGFIFGYYDAGTFWIDWVGVSKGHRNSGIAEGMASYIESVVKGCVHKIWCDCRTDNIESISGLKKLGYNKIAELKRHWYGLDFFIWEKIL